MDTSLPRDKASANTPDYEPDFEPQQDLAADASDDPSVLHADQLTAEDEIPARRPMPPRTKWVLLAVAIVVLIVGAIAAVQTLGRSSAQDVLDARDVVSSSVEGENGAAADVAVSADRNAAVVTFRDLPAPGDGQVYQLWKIPASGSAPVSVGSLSSGNIAGDEPAIVENIAGFRAAALTLEARGGAQSPTPPFMLEMELPAE
ncbi:hypothetical protein D477_014456 [Arthrobacter crystallopoietes BAB-32]|uniref:Anti-sigma K factor RskA C-terminal domain-containing protein n=1 Tax=Arthrobacter crystallopoietes BAB-32 TaxID=1246476 RepID=N1V5H7_9MICC|nr:anti-sigma factor [Arthrobacter crystallopoietes]EMY33518.1 hypothetical protein D477_014456 [Arthrobacter crystallopoietes BAB-32]